MRLRNTSVLTCARAGAGQASQGKIARTVRAIDARAPGMRGRAICRCGAVVGPRGAVGASGLLVPPRGGRFQYAPRRGGRAARGLTRSHGSCLAALEASMAHTERERPHTN